MPKQQTDASIYKPIDGTIRRWADRHALKLFTKWADGEARFAYVSSKAGECFQIAIDAPNNGQVQVMARCIEGRTANDLDGQVWTTTEVDLDTALEGVFQTVVAWMAPSKRYYGSTYRRVLAWFG
jgi:hypothetical protein